jgi:hypothetical protein
MEKFRQGPMLHLGVKGLDDDDVQTATNCAHFELFFITYRPKTSTLNSS